VASVSYSPCVSLLARASAAPLRESIDKADLV
jgi:hypothetical protein